MIDEKWRESLWEKCDNRKSHIADSTSHAPGYRRKCICFPGPDMPLKSLWPSSRYSRNVV